MEALSDDPGERRRRQAQPEEEPKTDWARHAYRVLDSIDNQVRRCASGR